MIENLHLLIVGLCARAVPYFNPLAEVGDLAFQLCSMGGELVSVEGLSDSLGEPVDPVLFDEPRWHATEAWISLQRLFVQGWLPVEESSAVLWSAMELGTDAHGTQ